MNSMLTHWGLVTNIFQVHKHTRSISWLLMPWVFASSAAMILTVCNVDVLVFLRIKCQQPVMLQCQRIIWNANIVFLLFFSQKNAAGQGWLIMSIHRWFKPGFQVLHIFLAVHTEVLFYQLFSELLCRNDPTCTPTCTSDLECFKCPMNPTEQDNRNINPCMLNWFNTLNEMADLADDILTFIDWNSLSLFFLAQISFKFIPKSVTLSTLFQAMAWRNKLLPE